MDGAGLTAAIFAGSRPRALATLVRSFRDLDTAEDLYQEACLRAAEHWRRDGVPRDPTAWLIKVARNAGLDRIRRSRRLSDAETALETHAPAGDHQADIAEAIDRTEYKDDVLRLMFMCCHPELKARAAGVAATLDTPSLAERTERLAAVQTMIYLLFNEGYSAAGGDEHIRHALCDEAIRLGRLLLELFPAQAELMGLLALCLLQHSRTRARIDGGGRLVSLEDQDRSLWDRAKIAEGRVLVERR